MPGFAAIRCVRPCSSLWRPTRHLLSLNVHDALRLKPSGNALSDNRRVTPRKDAFQVASLVAEGGVDAQECLVWDVSATGAQVELAPDIDVPDRFTLQVTTYEPPRRCHVVRREGRRLGVRFDG